MYLYSLKFCDKQKECPWNEWRKLLGKQINVGGVFAQQIFDLNVHTHTHSHFHTCLQEFVWKMEKMHQDKVNEDSDGGYKNNSNDKWCSLYSQTLNALTFKDTFSSFKRNAFTL